MPGQEMEGSNQAALKWQEAEEPTIKPGILEPKSQNQPQKRATQCLNEVKTEEVEAAAAAKRGALAGGE